MKIADAHHHLWDLENNRYPWLQEPVEHFAGDYSDIRRTYLIGDLQHDASEFELSKSVHLQAEYDHSDPVGETAWLQSVHDDPASEGLPSAAVAYANFEADDVEEVLARHCEYSVMRGIRYMLNYGDEPRMRFAPRDGLTRDPKWLSGYRQLAKFGLSFDCQVWPWQLQDAARLAGDNPDIPVILNHTGMPINRDPAGMSEWREGLKALAANGNASAKISGLGMLDREWDAERIRPFVLDTIEAFGTDRCMFASNYPVDRLFGTFSRIWRAFDETTRDFTPEERSNLFHDNAVRIYRL